ncbi:MAG: hypothetical protein M1274_02165 [Actinobacteria bacterium]|nr:hypothetical protein [Actinomycetota bacterium]
MGDEPLHWSEKAKTASPSGYPMLSLQGVGSPGRSKKRAVIGIGSALAALAVIVVVLTLMLTTGRHREVATSPTVSPTATTMVSASTTSSATTAVKPRAKNPGTSLHSQTGRFEDNAFGISFRYPASWLRAPLDVGYTDLLDGPKVAVGFRDPKGGSYGGGPADYIIVFAGTLTEEEAASGVETLLQQAVGYWKSTAPGSSDLRTIEPVARMVVNGMQGAQTTLEFRVQGLVLRSRLCLVTEGRSLCFFDMCTERKYEGENLPIFDAVLESLRLGEADTWT